MDFINYTVDQLNWWAILVAALAAFPIGFVWYDLKMGFGKKWMKMVGLKKSDVESGDGMAMTFGALTVFALATAFLLAVLLKATGTTGLVDSIVFGAIVGFVLRGGAHFIHNGFAKRPMALSFLDAGHDTLSMMVMAAILGVWV
jgi:hypothetical protein